MKKNKYISVPINLGYDTASILPFGEVILNSELISQRLDNIMFRLVPQYEIKDKKFYIKSFAILPLEPLKHFKIGLPKNRKGTTINIFKGQDE